VMTKEVRCAGYYGTERQLTEPSCGWEGPRADLRDGRTCPVCGAGHIVAISPQRRVGDWMLKTFTTLEILNGPERTLRHVEEALELAQACDVDAATLHRLVDYVFSRPVGKPGQEIAGSMVTLYAAASALGVDADTEFETELKRIQQPEVIERCRRRQHEKREALVPKCVCGAPSKYKMSGWCGDCF
jgi:hypothetical protein